jgi:hypothetical protein
MEVPKGIEDPDIKGQYWLLKWPLYGLKQSGQQWKKHLHGVLMGFRFTQAITDDCLYI